MLSISNTERENNSCGGGGCGEGIVVVLGEGVDGSSPNLCVTTYIVQDSKTTNAGPSRRGLGSGRA